MVIFKGTKSSHIQEFMKSNKQETQKWILTGFTQNQTTILFPKWDIPMKNLPVYRNRNNYSFVAAALQVEQVALDFE